MSSNGGDSFAQQTKLPIKIGGFNGKGTRVNHHDQVKSYSQRTGACPDDSAQLTFESVPLGRTLEASLYSKTNTREPFLIRCATDGKQEAVRPPSPTRHVLKRARELQALDGCRAAESLGH